MKYAYAAAAVFAGAVFADTIPYSVPPRLNVADYLTNEAQAEQFVNAVTSDAVAFQSSLTQEPQWSAFESALSTALGSSGFDQFTSQFLDTNANDATNPSTILQTPTWWTQVPTSAQAFYTSVVGAAVSIVNSDLTSVADATSSTGGFAPSPTVVVTTTPGSTNAAIAVITPAPIMKAAVVAGAGALAGAALLL